MTQSVFFKSVCSIVAALLFAHGTSFGQSEFSTKNKAGFSVGALSYTGRYSVGEPLMSHTSWAASVFYIPNIDLVKNLDFKAELLGAQVRGDNTDQVTDAARGYFSSNLVELSLKAEYHFIDLTKRQVSPYIATGPGFYGLLNYKTDWGTKLSSDKMGFVLPVAAGLKFRASEQVLLSLEGNLRLFNKNLDNVVSPNNPNRYLAVGIGMLYMPRQKNQLW